MNVAVIMLFLVNIRYINSFFDKNARLAVTVYLLISWLIMMAVYSLFLLNDPVLIIRVYLILSLLIFVYFVEPKIVFIKLFIFFTAAQSIFLIVFWFYLTLYHDIESYVTIRHFFNNKDWGDVYTFDGVVWKIQLLGNALLPFSLMVSMIYYKSVKRFFYVSLYISAILIAGNFAFLLGLLFFIILFFIFIKPITHKRIFLILSVFLFFSTVTFIPAKNYFMSVFESKAQSSNPMRIDQMNVLLTDMSDGYLSSMLGRGLGNTVDVVTNLRDYNGKVYYELQWMYFLNQTGFIFFSVYMFFMILLSIYFFKYRLLIIAYLSYLFYSLFNPYFFDTNHIVVVLVLISLKRFLDEKNNGSYSYL